MNTSRGVLGKFLYRHRQAILTTLKTQVHNLTSWRWWLGIRSKIVMDPPKKRWSVSVIIPAYNEEEGIAATIRSIQAQTYTVQEIIVIDDCSTDRTGAIARKLGVRVVRTNQNMGRKARAQNVGIALLKTELFVTVDADTILAPDAIEKTLPYLNDEKACCVCGFIIPQNIETTCERARFIEYLYGFGMMKSAQNHSGVVVVASGCFTVFRTDLVRAQGGFEERTLAEDMDLTWKLIESGYRIYYAQESISYTVDPHTWRLFCKQNDRWFRGFHQNVKVRKLNLFPIGIGFALLVYGYILWNLAGALMLPLVVLYLFTDSLQSVLFWVLAFQVVGVWPIVLHGAWRHNRLWKAITSLPAFFVVEYVNAFVYLRTIWKEYVVMDTLSVWNKGH